MRTVFLIVLALFFPLAAYATDSSSLGPNNNLQYASQLYILDTGMNPNLLGPAFNNPSWAAITIAGSNARAGKCPQGYDAKYVISYLGDNVTVRMDSAMDPNTYQISSQNFYGINTTSPSLRPIKATYTYFCWPHAWTY